MFGLFDRLYRWEGASRRWALSRPLAVYAALLAPGMMALMLLLLIGNRPIWQAILWPIFWLSIGMMFARMTYSTLRTLRAVWKAIRAQPHELQHWREP
ncbi:hypothetical protein [Sphingopyxis sp. MG]|uniref:hypothetical protein n=1 Tax=Sphingopyxis sp. MG TaxID=1866325 RepID=UPI000CDF3C6B|nr:hypothetical protein [Sphingopyxis sp. MG]AVA15183.1 hypothetical protein C3E99_16170 [Sphingopyxis sp. MG]